MKHISRYAGEQTIQSPLTATIHPVRHVMQTYLSFGVMIMFKKLSAIALVLGLGMPVAQAATDSTAILKMPASAFAPSKSKSFVINPELGRAWVEVDFYYSLSESSDHYRIAVPGLSYDKAKGEVVFQEGDKRVVCATVTPKGWGIFKHDQVKATGACELSHRYVKIPVDNGFTIEHVEQFEVHFKPS